jgi:D-arabinose 1-dehydrogenase-like Zn-dependent alcohol dehydrogenase
MKAIRYYRPNKPMKIEEIPRPEQGYGDATVRVAASGICHTELHFLSGLLNLGIAPMTLGHEVAGTVEAKLACAKELGADFVINGAGENVVERVREITHGRGADAIFELVGTKETMDNSMKSIAKRGRLVFIGYSPDLFTVHPIMLVITEAKVMGAVGNTLEELIESVRLVGEGKIKTIVDRTLKLDQFQEGIDILSAGKAVGRIVLKP